MTTSNGLLVIESVLHASLCPKKFSEIDALTFLNQDQEYEISTRCISEHNLSFNELATTIRIGFVDTRYKSQYREKFQSWFDEFNSELFLIDLCNGGNVNEVEKLNYYGSAYKIKWYSNKLVKFFIQFKCLGTDFIESRNGGGEGAIFCLEMKTCYVPSTNRCDSSAFGVNKQVHRGSANLKIFKFKGADRKYRYEIEKYEKEKSEMMEESIHKESELLSLEVALSESVIFQRNQLQYRRHEILNKLAILERELNDLEDDKLRTRESYSAGMPATDNEISLKKGTIDDEFQSKRIELCCKLDTVGHVAEKKKEELQITKKNIFEAYQLRIEKLKTDISLIDKEIEHLEIVKNKELEHEMTVKNKELEHEMTVRDKKLQNQIIVKTDQLQNQMIEIDTELEQHRIVKKKEFEHHRIVKSKELEHQTIVKSKELEHQTIVKSKELEHQTIVKSKELEHQTIDKSKELEHQAIIKSDELEHKTNVKSKELEHRKIVKKKELAHQMTIRTDELKHELYEMDKELLNDRELKRDALEHQRKEKGMDIYKLFGIQNKNFLHNIPIINKTETSILQARTTEFVSDVSGKDDLCQSHNILNDNEHKKCQSRELEIEEKRRACNRIVVSDYKIKKRKLREELKNIDEHLELIIGQEKNKMTSTDSQDSNGTNNEYEAKVQELKTQRNDIRKQLSHEKKNLRNHFSIDPPKGIHKNVLKESKNLNSDVHNRKQIHRTKDSCNNFVEDNNAFNKDNTDELSVVKINNENIDNETVNSKETRTVMDAEIIKIDENIQLSSEYRQINEKIERLKQQRTYLEKEIAELSIKCKLEENEIDQQIIALTNETTASIKKIERDLVSVENEYDKRIKQISADIYFETFNKIENDLITKKQRMEALKQELDVEVIAKEKEIENEYVVKYNEIQFRKNLLNARREEYQKLYNQPLTKTFFNKVAADQDIVSTDSGPEFNTRMYSGLDMPCVGKHGQQEDEINNRPVPDKRNYNNTKCNGNSETNLRELEQARSLMPTDTQFTSKFNMFNINQVIAWLVINNFKDVSDSFRGYSGSDILKLSRSDMEELIGVRDAIRLMNILNQSRINPVRVIHVAIDVTGFHIPNMRPMIYREIILYNLDIDEFVKKMVSIISIPIELLWEILIFRNNRCILFEQETLNQLNYETTFRILLDQKQADGGKFYFQVMLIEEKK